MNDLAYRTALQEKIQKKFYGHDTLKSKYVPPYAISAERQYSQAVANLYRLYNKVVLRWMPKITNKSGKIIHLGSMMLLPGESGELPKAYENNPIVSFLEDRGAVEVARKNAESDEKVTPSEVPTEKPSPAEIPAGEPSNAEAKRGAAKK